tara:strand:+ start:7300 stop:9486 length:2187 start_codon:yes stop_codon:yes gene_type:complete
MKTTKFTIYSFLLLLFIILITAVIIEYRKKKLMNMLNKKDELDLDIILENFADNDNLITNFKITKAKVIKIEDDDYVKEYIGQKVLLIEGTNLGDIKNVFFGNFNGTIITPNEISNDKNIYILPPDFRTYSEAELDLNNLEIKFLIQKNDILQNPEYIAQSGKDLITLNFKDENEGNSNLETLKSKLSFKLSSDNDSDFNIKINGKTFGPYVLEKSKPKEYSFIINVPNPKQNKNIDIKLEIDNLLECYPSPEESNPACSDDRRVSIKVLEPKLEYMFDDLYNIFPTGMFYRFNSLKELLVESDAWNIYLDYKDIDGKNKFENPEIQGFYKEMSSIFKGAEIIKEPEEVKETYEPKNLSLTIDTKNDSLMNLIWDKPTKPLDRNFTYVLDLKLIDTDTQKTVSDNQKSADNIKELEIKNKKISFEDTKFVFSNNEMIPMNIYNVTLYVYNYSNSKKFKGSKIEYKYQPGDINKYHKHIFKDGKFNTELTQSNPNLVKTYFQLNAYNKMKTQDNLLATNENIQASSKCLANNLNKINNNGTKDKYDNAFEELLKKEQEEEKAIFRIKQQEQEEDLGRINTKIAKLEKLQGKVKDTQDSKIKSLKSMRDGTNLSLINLNNNKRLVKLNQGCLTRKPNGEYGYIPCNLLDKEQYFNLSQVKNVDEYNNLMMMNNNTPIDKDDSIEYPFYILQPEHSQKCVNVENKELSIKQCTNDNTIRFTGNFVNQNCSV